MLAGCMDDDYTPPLHRGAGAGEAPAGPTAAARERQARGGGGPGHVPRLRQARLSDEHQPHIYSSHQTLSILLEHIYGSIWSVTYGQLHLVSCI